MTTSGFSSDGNIFSYKVETAKVMATSSDVEEECIGGGCGQVLSVADHNTQQTESNFQSCKNAKENALSMVFEELQKMKAEMKKNEEKNKKEFQKEILELKSEFKKELEKKDVALSTLFRKVKVLEEKVMEVNGRVSEMTETISTMVHSILEAKGTISADTVLLDELDRSKKETEVLREQLKESERETRTIKSQLEELKIETETVSEQLKTNNKDLQEIKGQLKDEEAKNESTNLMSFNVEQSPLDQFAIPMTCFNLVTDNDLFQPSFKWTIDGIEAIMVQKTFELSSELFQWNGYPVRARAKLQLKEDGRFNMSLCLKDNGQAKDLKPIPRVFYLLKDKFAINPKHKCYSGAFLAGPKFSNSLQFNQRFANKLWFNHSSYKVDDSVEIAIYLEPSAMTQHAHSYDGRMEWNIENYARRSQLEKDWQVPYHESPCFYTSERGYRVQVKMYLELRLSAYVMFLTGKFDAELPESFPHSTTVTFLNRRNPERSIKKTIVEDTKNKKMYKFEMCKVEEVADLIENDTLFCKVIIESQ